MANLLDDQNFCGAGGLGDPRAEYLFNNVYRIVFDEKGAASLCIPLRGNVMNSLSRLPSSIERPFLQRESFAALISQRRCNRLTPCVATTQRVLAREIVRHYARVIPGAYGYFGLRNFAPRCRFVNCRMFGPLF